MKQTSGFVFRLVPSETLHVTETEDAFEGRTFYIAGRPVNRCVNTGGTFEKRIPVTFCSIAETWRV